jgi:hypothetical protein
MKTWFPFTDYDFYAYLTGGFLLLFTLDYSLNGGAIMLRTEWPVVQVILAVATAYIVGQLLAAPSSILLEHAIARRLLHPPSDLLLGLKAPRRREKFIQRWITGRDYAPLPSRMLERIFDRAAGALGTTREKIKHSEEVFQLAYAAARRVPDTALRLDQLRTLYGLSRNVAFASGVSGVLLLGTFLTSRPANSAWLAAAAFIVASGMYARFLKFYAGFAAEVFRSYAAESSASKRE